MQLHIVPKLTGFENVFYKLPDQIIGELERAIQTITPFSGQPAISVARMALWPVDKCLDFSIIKETVTSSFSFKDTPHVMFFLKDENDWKKQADHFQQKILPLCQEKQIMVLTLPELTAPPGLLELLKAAMKNHHQAQVDKARAAATTGPVVSYPLLLVAGSFHISQDDDPQQAVNQALVLDKRGDEIILEHYLRPPLNFDGEPKWSMEKLHPFTIRNSQLSNAPELARNLGLDDVEVEFATEPGRLGDKLPIVHAGALGRMAVVICIDFLAGLKSWLDKFQGKGWMDWLFVPAASTETAPFAATNKDWGNRGVCTLVVNACWLVEAANKWPAQFVQAGIPTGLPTDGQRKRWHAWEHPELKTSDKFGLSPKTTDCCTMGCDNCLSILEVELDGRPRGPLTAQLH
ncbi:MAG: hypothetical protein HQL55_11975 [Magnetococcales bacterium]|nr:hypothetical protein [Magnetococcales bacterium]